MLKSLKINQSLIMFTTLPTRGGVPSLQQNVIKALTEIALQ